MDKKHSDFSAGTKTIYKKSKKRILGIAYGRALVIIALLAIQLLGLFFSFAYFEKHLSVVVGGFTLISVAMAIFIANTKDNPSIKLSWTALIMATPVFGTLLYIFIHAEIGHRLISRLFKNVLEKTSCFAMQDLHLNQELKANEKDLYNTARYTFENARCPVYKKTSTKYFPCGKLMWEDMLCELEKANDFIFLEYFIIEEGEMWGKILDILKRKASEGVEVRVIYDGTCSVSLLPHSYPKTLASFGIKCRVFSPLRPFVSTHYNNRDHRKILVVDGRVAFTGGVNLADEYINSKTRFGHWKDCGIKISGEAVKSFTLMFLQIWNVYPNKENYQYYLEKSINSQNAGSDGYIIPYGDSPLDDEKVGETMYLNMINTAKEYIYIMTPYLAIDNEMTTALKNAAKRGVDVRIIIPHIPDHKITHAIAKTHCCELVPAGVKIFEYLPGFIHSKVFVSDSIHAIVGTINLDYRSLYLHFECAAYIYKSSVIDDIYKDFADTFPKCKKIEAGDLEKQNFLSHMKGGLLKLIAPLI